jgi:hypothetical protein
MQEQGVVPNVYCWSCLAQAYSANPQALRGVMGEMAAAGVAPNVISWNMLLKASRSRGSDAIRALMEEMQSQAGGGVQPDVVSYSIFLSSLLNSHGEEIVIDVFNTHLKGRPKLVNNYIVTALLRALAVSGDASEVLAVYRAYERELTEKDLRMLQTLARHPRRADSPTWQALGGLLEESVV